MMATCPNQSVFLSMFYMSFGHQRKYLMHRKGLIGPCLLQPLLLPLKFFR